MFDWYPAGLGTCQPGELSYVGLLFGSNDFADNRHSIKECENAERHIPEQFFRYCMIRAHMAPRVEGSRSSFLEQ